MMDFLIAATALEHNLVLVTNNLSDYIDVTGLVIETSQSLGRTD